MPTSLTPAFSDAPTLPQAASPRKPLETFTTRLAFVAVVAALFGQPNAFFLYFPPYPVLMLLVMTLLSGVIVFVQTRSRPVRLPRINIALPTIIFLVLSLFSLSYSPDPSYGGRILFSMLFKFLLFLALVIVCVKENEIRKLLLLLAVLGGIFSAQGLLIIIGTVFFHLQPIGFYGSASSFGTLEGRYDLLSFGILGFIKVSYDFGGIQVARCQGMFLEPGWLATFLELSLFATLGWFALTGYAYKKWAFCLLGIQALAFLLTFSSAGYFAIVWGLAVYGGSKMFVRPGVLSRRQMTRLFTVMVGAFGVLILLGLAFPEVAQRVSEEIVTNKVNGDTSSGSDRLSKASAGLDLFLQRPIFGWGSNQSSVLDAGKDTGDALLSAASDLGIVGLAVYLAMLGAISWTAWTNLQMAYRLKLPSAIGLSAALAGCLVSSVIHSLLVTIQWQFSYWIGFALVYCNRMLLLQMTAASNFGVPPEDLP